MFYALVDLKDFQGLPDVYFVPSSTIYTYFEGGDPKTWIRARYHPLIEVIAAYKNNVGPFVDILGQPKLSGDAS